MLASTPTSGCSRNSHIRLATATDVATVDENMARKTPIPRRYLSASTARPTPSTRPIGTVIRANFTVTPKRAGTRCCGRRRRTGPSRWSGSCRPGCRSAGDRARSPGRAGRARTPPRITVDGASIRIAVGQVAPAAHRRRSATTPTVGDGPPDSLGPESPQPSRSLRGRSTARRARPVTGPLEPARRWIPTIVAPDRPRPRRRRARPRRRRAGAGPARRRHLLDRRGHRRAAARRRCSPSTRRPAGAIREAPAGRAAVAAGGVGLGALRRCAVAAALRRGACPWRVAPRVAADGTQRHPLRRHQGPPARHARPSAAPSSTRSSPSAPPRTSPRSSAR